jgi:predicted nuclease of predicted toxin-antitoxin system
MKLLLDQNLSHRIVTSLDETYPDSSQVSLLGMGESDDKAIWDYAKSHHYVIVTPDTDFHDYSVGAFCEGKITC